MFALHDDLIELCEISNRNYSNQMVIFVTGAFVVIMFGLFFELKVTKKIVYPLSKCCALIISEYMYYFRSICLLKYVGAVLGVETTNSNDILCIILFVLEHCLFVFDIYPVEHMHTDAKRSP